MDQKRKSVRGIITTSKGLVAIYRKKAIFNDNKEIINYKEYYVLPGGGIEANENKEDALKRELKEELNIEVDNIKYAFEIENSDRIEYFYTCDYINGDFTIIGEEKDRNTENNYYEPCFIPLKKIEDYAILEEVKDYFKRIKK